MTGDLYYADVRINVRVYFTDNGEDALSDQAYEVVEDSGLTADDPGFAEFNGAEVLCLGQISDLEREEPQS